MSVEAMTWALTEAPGVPSSCVAVLIGLANHADPDGRNAFPSKETLARYARKTVRQVVRDLDGLVQCGAIYLGDQEAAARIRADRRPKVYDLALTGGHPRHPVTHMREDTHVTPQGSRGDTDDMSSGERGDTSDRTGCHPRPNGVTPTSPEPSLTVPEPKEITTHPAKAASVGDTRERETRPTANDALRLIRSALGYQFVGPVQTDLTRRTAELLQHYEPDLIREALTEWATRTGIGPGLLPSLVADAVKRRNGHARATPTARPSTTDSRVAAVYALAQPDRPQLPGAPS